MKLNTLSFYVFIKYLVPALLIIIVMLNRAMIIKWLIYSLGHLNGSLRRAIFGNIRLHRLLVSVISHELVFFTRDDNVSVLNRVMMYVTRT